jgi:hypothetical protein
MADKKMFSALVLLLTGCGDGFYFNEMTPAHFKYAEALCNNNGGVESAGGQTHSSTGEMLAWARCNNGAVFDTRPVPTAPKDKTP